MLNKSVKTKYSFHIAIISIFISLLALSLQFFSYRDSAPKLTLNEDISFCYFLKPSNEMLSNFFYGIIKIQFENNSNQPIQITKIELTYTKQNNSLGYDSLFFKESEYAESFIQIYNSDEKLKFFRENHEKYLLKTPISLNSFSSANGYLLFPTICDPQIILGHKISDNAKQSDFLNAKLIVKTTRGTFNKNIRLFNLN